MREIAGKEGVKTGLPAGVPGGSRVPLGAKIRRNGGGTGETRTVICWERTVVSREREQGGAPPRAQISRSPMTALPFFRLIQTGFGVISNPADFRQPTKNLGETALPAQRQ